SSSSSSHLLPCISYDLSVMEMIRLTEGNVQQYVLFPLWSSDSKNPQNTDDDATFEVKKPEFEVEKPKSAVHVSPSSSAKT
nr:hypothetical protein [Tanacetum cinerariifolium]